jgi:hypothetical protein
MPNIRKSGFRPAYTSGATLRDFGSLAGCGKSRLRGEAVHGRDPGARRRRSVLRRNHLQLAIFDCNDQAEGCSGVVRRPLRRLQDCFADIRRTGVEAGQHSSDRRLYQFLFGDRFDRIWRIRSNASPNRFSCSYPVAFEFLAWAKVAPDIIKVLTMIAVTNLNMPPRFP